MSGLMWVQAEVLPVFQGNHDMAHQNLVPAAPTTLPSPVDFEAYSRAVNALPMLSEARERELALAWRDHQDKNAARELVLAHLRLVTRVVKDHRGYGLPDADLAQEGAVGLMKAVRGFDPLRGIRLAAYAIRWIEAEIREFIFRSWRLVRLAGGATMKKLFFGYRRTVEALREHGSERPVGVSPQDIAKALGVDDKSAAMAMEYFAGSDDSMSLLESDADAGRANVLEAQASNVANEEHETDPMAIVGKLRDDDMARRAMARAWEGLDERSRGVLAARRFSEPAVPLREVSEKWGVSIERARQIEVAAWDKLVSMSRELLHSPRMIGSPQ